MEEGTDGHCNCEHSIEYGKDRRKNGAHSRLALRDSGAHFGHAPAVKGVQDAGDEMVGGRSLVVKLVRIRDVVLLMLLLMLLLLLLLLELQRQLWMFLRWLTRWGKNLLGERLKS